MNSAFPYVKIDQLHYKQQPNNASRIVAVALRGQYKSVYKIKPENEFSGLILIFTFVLFLFFTKKMALI